MAEEQALSITRSCAVAKPSRAAYYRSQSDSAQRDGAVIAALNEVVAKHQRWGFWKCFDRLRLLGHGWNHKRVYRVYCGMKLNLPRRTKQRVPQRERRSLVVPALPNAVWAVDFCNDPAVSAQVRLLMQRLPPVFSCPVLGAAGGGCKS